MIITLCGSTRFKAEFFGWAKRLTYEGHIVLMPFIYGHCGDQVNDNTKEMLDKLHLDKILLSERIDIICPGNYIGESTKKEIEIAKTNAIKVVYHHHPYCFGDGEPEDTARCLFCSAREACYNMNIDRKKNSTKQWPSWKPCDDCGSKLNKNGYCRKCKQHYVICVSR